jgi:hypothetical protein
MTKPIIRSRHVALALGSVALLVGACGRTAELETRDGGADGATGSPSAGDALAPFDGSIAPLVDSGVAQPDAGPPPVVPCADAGMACPTPPSECLDEHTMRYFTGGTCNGAGTCDYTSFTMKCDPSPIPPDCYQGGCRVVIVR